MREGVGFGRGEAMDGSGTSRARPGLPARGRRGLTGRTQTSARKEEGWRTPSGLGVSGPWPKHGLGRIGCRGLLSLFFRFPFSFISFAKLVQINSKKILNYSIIQHNVLNQ
jgi:hypothetical protein